MEDNLIIFILVILFLILIALFQFINGSVEKKILNIENSVDNTLKEYSKNIVVAAELAIQKKVQEGFEVSSKDIILEVLIEKNHNVLKSVSLQELIKNKSSKYEDIFHRLIVLIQNYEGNIKKYQRTIDKLEDKISTLNATLLKSKENGTKQVKEIIDRLSDVEATLILLQKEEIIVEDDTSSSLFDDIKKLDNKIEKNISKRKDKNNFLH